MAMDEQDEQVEGLQEPIAPEIDPKFIVSLKGKQYLMYGGVLDAVTRVGIKSLTTEVIQIPTPENGYLAIVQARLEMKDGRLFQDVGDCSPASASAQLAASSLRFASTRAKGRVCRDAINCAATLADELGDAPPLAGAEHSRGQAGNAPAAVRPAQPAARANGVATAPAAAGTGGTHPDGTVACQEPGCGVLLTKSQITLSQHKTGGLYCPAHSGAHAKA